MYFDLLCVWWARVVGVVYRDVQRGWCSQRLYFDVLCVWWAGVVGVVCRDVGLVKNCIMRIVGVVSAVC